MQWGWKTYDALYMVFAALMTPESSEKLIPDLPKDVNVWDINWMIARFFLICCMCIMKPTTILLSVINYFYLLS